MQHSLRQVAELIVASAFGVAICGAATRTLEFQTTQVTGASVALSPDGKTIVFSMLGHLFGLPASGGAADQLSFGPFYDDSPVYSPDGSQVAFVSDRDGSEGNIFVLSLKTRHILQVTHEEYASRPVWSPDGASLVYLRYARLPAWTLTVLQCLCQKLSVCQSTHPA